MMPPADRGRRGAFGLGLLLALLLIFPALASADQETITFESPLPLNAPLDESAGHRIHFPVQEGFRPYPTAVGADLAKAGTAVGHIGRCVEEVEATGAGDPEGCLDSHAQTTAVLTESAETVTVFAGVFGSEPPTFAILRTFDAGDTLLETTGPVELSEARFGFHQRLAVQDPEGRIAKFTIESTVGPNGVGRRVSDLGIDELSVGFAQGGKPDFGLTAVNRVLALVQGQQLDVPVHVTRLNGSRGDIEVNVTGLPEGVSTNPLTLHEGETDGTLTLTADRAAPDTDFVPSEGHIVAAPSGIAVGPATRTTPLRARVATDFKLSSGDVVADEGRKILVQAPDCAAVDVPIAIARDIAMTRNVDLSVLEETSDAIRPPSGIEAELLPEATVPPGGSLVAQRTLRLRALPGSELPFHAVHLILTGTDGPGGNSRSLELIVTRVTRAKVASNVLGSGLGDTPRFGRQGTPVQVHGLGFCPGTEVAVGNDRAIVSAALVNDQTLEFRVPRYATSGPLKILPPGPRSEYKSDDRLTVDSVRNSDGFAFKNYVVDSLGIDEFTKAFGADSLFIHVNPCWPFGDCSVNTGILSPLAAIDWGWMNIGVQGSGGHCVGISLAAEQLREGRLTYREIADPEKGSARSAYEATNRGGPSDILNTLLDAYQARSYSDEFLSARFTRQPSFKPQLVRLEAEFSKNRKPMVVLQKGLGAEHAMIAYDLTQTQDKAEISVYDGEEPFTESENLAEANPTIHQLAVQRSTITIDKTKGTWTYPIGNWSGSATNGGFWVVPGYATPANPSLPGLDTLKGAVNSLGSIAFGSSDGSARAGDQRSAPRQARVGFASASDGATQFLPTAEAGVLPGSSGVWVTDDLAHPLNGVVEGVKPGHYTQAYSAPGFVASASDVATAKGVVDRFSALHGSLSVESGRSRPLELNLARRSSANDADAATVQTQASRRGSDTVGLSRAGALTYAHEGAATTTSFSLTSVRRNGGGSTFLSGPLQLEDGDRLEAAPLDRALRRVRLRIRHADGSTTTRILRNRAHPAGRIRLRAARTKGAKIVLPFRLSSFHGANVVGASLRLKRGGRILLRRAVALRGGNGAHRASWKLPPKLAGGRYRALVAIRVASAGSRGSTVSQSVLAQQSGTIRLPARR